MHTECIPLYLCNNNNPRALESRYIGMIFEGIYELLNFLAHVNGWFGVLRKCKDSFPANDPASAHSGPARGVKERGTPHV